MADDPSPPRQPQREAGWLQSFWSEGGALLALLFDFSFKRYLTPRLIRILYSLSLLAAVLSALAWMASGFQEGVMRGLFTLVTGPVAFVIYVLTARVVMELVLAVFRIAEHIEKLPPASAPGERKP